MPSGRRICKRGLRDQALRAEADHRTVQREKQAVAASRAAWEQAQAKVEAKRLELEEERRLVDQTFEALDQSRQTTIRFMQMVQRYPESRWLPEILLMAKAATPIAKGPEPDLDLLRAHMLRAQFQNR